MLHYRLLFFFLLVISSNLLAQVLPAERRTDWSKAGLTRPRPHYTNIKVITNFGAVGDGATPADAALSAAIQSLGSDSGTIFFPSGKYLFHLPITLRSGLVLRGGDASSSTLLFDLGGLHHAINITGSETADTALVTVSANKNSPFIIAPGAPFGAGEYIKLYHNDTALVDDALFSAGQIIRIKSVSGDTLWLESQLRKNYLLADIPRVKRLQMVNGSGIECLKITRLDSTSLKRSNIYMEFAADCWITGVESDTTNFAHVEVANSTNIHVSGSYFHHAFGYGPNGQAYGISAEWTTGECLFENNIFERLRHAMLVQSGANGNVFAYNYSRDPFKSEQTPFNLAGELVLHGNYPYLNLFEGNIVGNIVADASHGINGPFNTFFRNRTILYGVLMNTGSGDSTNYIGNEITGSGFVFGNYRPAGAGNFEYGNNHKGVVIPAGTNNLVDTSYYYNEPPGFWTNNFSWPPIGISNTISSGNTPAINRYNSGSTFTRCSPQYKYVFNRNGDWNNAANWLNNMVAPYSINTGSNVVIDPVNPGSCILQGKLIIAENGIFTIKAGKQLQLLSN